MNILIVAMDPLGHIGYHGHMPWHDAKELSRFRELTMDHPVLMGRKTWESIAHPLDGRIVHVATRKAAKLPHDVYQCKDALSMIQDYQKKNEVLMIGGGRELYELALPYVDKLYISVMKQTYQADTCFSKWDATQFVCLETIEYETFIWYAYQRKKGAICDL